MGSLLLIATSLVTIREAENALEREKQNSDNKLAGLPICQLLFYSVCIQTSEAQIRFPSFVHEEWRISVWKVETWPDTAPRGPESNQICLAMIYLATSGSVAPAYYKKLPTEHYSATGYIECWINYYHFWNINIWLHFGLSSALIVTFLV